MDKTSCGLKHEYFSEILNSLKVEAERLGYDITFINHNVAGVLGQVLSILAEAKINVIDMVNRSRGELAYNILDAQAAPPSAVLQAIARVENVIRVRMI